jgi:hypothetical protein
VRLLWDECILKFFCIPLPDVNCGDYLSSLLHEVVDEGMSSFTDEINMKLDDLVETFNTIHSTDTEQCDSYQTIFTLLRGIEDQKLNQKDRTKLKYSGLERTIGPMGKYMWVSPVAKETYRYDRYDRAREKFTDEKLREEKKKLYLESDDKTKNLFKK